MHADELSPPQHNAYRIWFTSQSAILLLTKVYASLVTWVESIGWLRYIHIFQRSRSISCHAMQIWRTRLHSLPLLHIVLSAAGTRVSPLIYVSYIALFGETPDIRVEMTFHDCFEISQSVFPPVRCHAQNVDARCFEGWWALSTHSAKSVKMPAMILFYQDDYYLFGTRLYI